jgi:hypothetical protein
LEFGCSCVPELQDQLRKSLLNYRSTYHLPETGRLPSTITISTRVLKRASAVRGDGSHLPLWPPNGCVVHTLAGPSVAVDVAGRHLMPFPAQVACSRPRYSQEKRCSRPLVGCGWASDGAGGPGAALAGGHDWLAAPRCHGACDCRRRGLLVGLACGLWRSAAAAAILKLRLLTQGGACRLVYSAQAEQPITQRRPVAR